MLYKVDGSAEAFRQPAEEVRDVKALVVFSHTVIALPLRTLVEAGVIGGPCSLWKADENRLNPSPPFELARTE